MIRQVRIRFWIELILAVVNITLLALTAVWTEWIELALGVEPDGARVSSNGPSSR